MHNIYGAKHLKIGLKYEILPLDSLQSPLYNASELVRLCIKFATYAGIVVFF